MPNDPDKCKGIADVNRIARDYALMRVELMEPSDLIGYSETDLKDLCDEFHSTQCKVLSALPAADRICEFEYTKKFEQKMKSLKHRLRSQIADSKPFSNKEGFGDICAKLPKINIKPFDGLLVNWVSFIQLFDSLIHTKKNISNVEKMHYLFTSVQGPALDLTKNLPITDESYTIAYNILQKQFNRTRHIAVAYYERLLNCEPIKTKNSNELKRVSQTFSENLSVLDKYKLPDKNFMLFHLLWLKLDKATREAFELEHNSNDIPRLETLQEFIEKHIQALEVTNSNLYNNTGAISKPNKNYRLNNNKSSFVVSSLPSCPCCTGQHGLQNCENFKKLDTNSRFNFVKEKNLCILCFSGSHRVKNCTVAFRCNKCKFSHNSLLHFDKDPEPKPQNNLPVVESNTVLTTLQTNSNVLFSTARVLIKDKFGNFKSIRVLLDSASACNFISLRCANLLGLKICHDIGQVNGIGHTVAKPIGSISCEIKPVNPEYDNTIKCQAFVLSSICSEQPTQCVNLSRWSHIQGLDLADPVFHQPGPIDMLLNGDILASSLLPGLRHGELGQPKALHTIFGWIILGGYNIEEVELNNRNRNSKNKSCFLISNLALNNSLKRFWELENVSLSLNKNILSENDKQCEDYFLQNHSRTAEGRFIVPLPFADPSNKPKFSNSREIALKRFMSLERKLDANVEFKRAYVSFMADYETLGHMEKIESPIMNSGNFYYIPHHGVLRPESVSTPLRVVFDASAKDSNGMSLNDTLLPGPKLQADIFELLIRFRWHLVVCTGDIRQMYRQVLVPRQDAEYQRILWRSSSDSPMSDYRLLTVTYGVSSAPFQAMRTIAQLAKDSTAAFPMGSAVLNRDIYVDDVVTGTSSIELAKSLKCELVQVLSSGGFHLRKWASNHKDFFSDIPSEELYSETFKQFDDSSNVSLKILGLLWLPSSDQFTFRVNVENRKCTKRTILSDIARIFDPLGFLCPLTFHAKYLIQLLWTSGVSWDDEAPRIITLEWLKFKNELSTLAALSIPRRMIQNFISLQLHGFCDASERGYCAVIYCRVVNSEAQCFVAICCAKSKVAPLRKLSIPRLELQAAVLLSDLMSSVVDALKPVHAFQDLCAWSDSSVALAWIKSCPSKWKTFVANRVSHIQEMLSPECWRHVSSGDNPADIGSRGLLPKELVHKELWWNGPSWLRKTEECWPRATPLLSHEQEIVGQEHGALVLVASLDYNHVDHLLQKFSSLAKIKNIVAYCFRFIRNSRIKVVNDRFYHELQPSESENALKVLILHTQSKAFSKEIDHLKRGTPNQMSKDIRKLAPFLDSSGFLRVGGRLAHADLSFDVKHPYLLPRNSRFTFLLIDEYHKKFMHPGVQTLQNLLAQNFWILSPKRAIRSVVCNCMKCFRAKPQLAPPPFMGNLPAYRVSQVKPFASVAIDYGGPFDIAMGRGRGVRTFKGYICVFVCTSTKAVHLELASELSTEAFLAALKRFIARRGRCSNIISDQGRNFVGASNYLNNLMKHATHKQSIKFSFNPPGSPHFNGLAEAGIKSIKTHLARVVGTQRLTFEEFYTVLSQIEALLNSRPLTQLSSDLNDLKALTPGHFLTLEPLTVLPEENLVNEKISLINRWKLVQKIHQDFWCRWRTEYTHTLQQRAKWNKAQNMIAVGALVLILNEQTNPLHWPLGRIVALHPGSDGVCRVVTVKTSTGEYKRPVVKLCPLPLMN